MHLIEAILISVIQANRASSSWLDKQVGVNMSRDNRKASIEKLIAFYDALALHVNKDGYSFITINRAVEAAGSAPSSAIRFARQLHELGCIELFECRVSAARMTTLVKIIERPNPVTIIKKEALEKLTHEERNALSLS